MSKDVMEQLIFAVTVLGLLALPFYWNHILTISTIRRRTGGLLTDGELGLAEIQLPPGWKGTATTTTASIQATDRFRRRFVMVISESHEDFTTDMQLADFSRVTFELLCGSARLVEVRGPERRTLCGFDALQTEAVTIVRDRHLVKYLHSAIRGERGFHQVIVWSSPSAYDRALFERVVEGFRERSGPTAFALPASNNASTRVH